MSDVSKVELPSAIEEREFLSRLHRSLQDFVRVAQQSWWYASLTQDERQELFDIMRKAHEFKYIVSKKIVFGWENEKEVKNE
ncbi:MAG: hypothetical protein C4342_02560 [Armatimonadota bacterium]